MKTSYIKKALTLSEQIDLLLAKKMIIENKVQCEKFLSHVSLYRFSEYFLPFQINPAPESHFSEGVSFEKIANLYEFDKNLRLLIGDALETIEIAFRTAISNEMAIRHRAFWYMQADLFKNSDQHQNSMERVREVCARSDEHAIRQYYKKYDAPEFPPSWLLIENLTFGHCSKLFGNLKILKDKKAIAGVLQKHPTVIDSWMRALVYMRNLNAHHARVWNRWFVIQPIAVPQGNTSLNTSPIYWHFHIITELLGALVKHTDWTKKLFVLIQANSSINNVEAMGFQKSWQDDPIFRRL